MARLQTVDMDPNLGLARETPHLMALPQEMLDMIFELAYANDEKFTVVARSGWTALEKDRRDRCRGGARYHLRPFPEVKVQEFMVSKAFFTAAAKAFIQSRTITGTARDIRAYRDGINTIVSNGIGRAWIRGMAIRMRVVPAPVPSRLRSLIVEVNDIDFRSCDLEPWYDDLSEADFAKLERVAPNATTKACWDRNVQRLDKLIRSKVLQCKVASSGSYRPGDVLHKSALYPGSLVSATSSTLLSERPASSDLFDMVLSRESTSGALRANQSFQYALTARDIPSSVEELVVLLMTKGTAVMAWIDEVKKRMPR
ncbi:hypothetical protein LTR17_020737 [Elasticomyces elasticus]|nr:hypothetical protein LTR17_020737 [Elasticomyces elasticus]